MQPRFDLFEAQVIRVVEHLADIYERNTQWKKAANVLLAIPLENGQT